EVGLQSDAEQPTLGSAVDRQGEHRGYYPADHMLHLARRLLEDKEIVGAEKCHAGRLTQTGDDGGDSQARVEHDRPLAWRQRGRVNRQRTEKPMLFVVDPGREEQRAGRGIGDAEAELQAPDAGDIDRLAAGVTDLA